MTNVIIQIGQRKHEVSVKFKAINLTTPTKCNRTLKYEESRETRL